LAEFQHFILFRYADGTKTNKASGAPTDESCVMVKQKDVSECRPTAPLLPVRPGGFGKPLWQLVN